ncbi:MAG: hypothetical protein JSR37_05525 [Verrucomicrobia bacterium]|nr:hypothetical protein [Verrucomicrobiota bacterium]
MVKDSNGIYILSNTHVFAGDTAAGGNGKVSAKGDPINQPGYVDINCQKRPADYVATLERWIKLVPNGTTSVDAAIAKTTSSMVNSQGSILDIGLISSTPRAAFVGQKVKKSGRTSGLTTGQVSALNATVSVGYSKECAGSSYVTTFRNQILVTPGSFIRPGDSGSLMVENISVKPRPIGLLFAGSSSIAVANPIQSVLTALQVSMVGTPTTLSESTQFEKLTADSFAKALTVQEKHADSYLTIPGVIGHALKVSSEDTQKAAIVFLVEKQSAALAAKLPKTLDGTPVELLEVGTITAY